MAAESLAATRGNAAPRQGLRPDGITYSDLVSACGQGTQPQRALQLLEVMWHQGILPDRIPYNALVSACGQGTQPQRVYSSSRQCGTKPPARRDPLQCLGKLLRKGYTTAERFAAPEPMRYQGLLPDGIPSRALDNACGKGAMPQTALGILGGRAGRSCQTGSPTTLWTVPVRRVGCGREPRLNS